MAKYLLLKHYSGGPTPVVDLQPIDQWAPDEVEAHMKFMSDFMTQLEESGEFVDAQALSADGAFVRYDGEGQIIACLVNFSTEPRPDHRIGLPEDGVWNEILNTDAAHYDGTGEYGNLGQVVAKPVPSHGYPASALVTIPPLGAVWLLFETESVEEQPEPQKIAVGMKVAARRASPTVAAEQESLRN